MSPEDVRWEGENPGIFNRGSRPDPGRGNKKAMAHGGALAGARRGRGTMKGQSRKYIPLSQNGIGKKALGDIEILHTDALIKEGEKVFGTSHPEVRQQRKCLKNTNKH